MESPRNSQPVEEVETLEGFREVARGQGVIFPVVDYQEEVVVGTGQHQAEEAAETGHELSFPVSSPDQADYVGPFPVITVEVLSRIGGEVVVEG